jgi:hypothetical protein
MQSSNPELIISQAAIHTWQYDDLFKYLYCILLIYTPWQLYVWKFYYLNKLVPVKII